MCRVGFMEAETNIIILPEDNPRLIEFTVMFLYTSRFNIIGGESDPRSHRLHPAWLADLYLIGDKYQLASMQTYILQVCTDTFNHMSVLTFLHRIYNHNPFIKEPLQSFTIQSAPGIIRVMTRSEK